MDSETLNKPKPSDNAVDKKRIYRKPGVQVYGTLSQITAAQFATGRRSDSPGGIPISRRT